MAIASLGVGSGLDLGSLVQSLVTSERAPAENRLNRNASKFQAQISAFGQVKSGLATLNDSLVKLQELADARTITVSDTKLLTATATADADVGNYSVEVFSLARAQSLASDGFVDADASLGAGEITLSVGDGDPATITLLEGEDSLRDVRDAINAAEAGVNATLVRDGDDYRLLLSAEETGLANTISLTAGAGVDARLASAAMTQTTAAADSSFSVSGLLLSSSTNVVEDVLPGLTLTLKGETEENVPVAVTVAQDRASARKAVESFITAYNASIGQADTLSKFNAETGTGAVLTGDTTLRAIRGMLPNSLGASNFGEFNLVELGVTSDITGKLSLDTETFDALMSEDPGSVLASLNAFGERLGADVSRYSESQGLLDTRTEGLQSSLKSIDAQREALDARMESFEARLTRQFGALDQLVAQLQSTGNFLTTQLESIGNIQNFNRNK
ncbi:flagellar filament capping protein FliD [Wenzhouxiangella sp. XN24]|uniref:flagellar filament capping protein FliD n=1 Tax=Wenzhouxiangella sp. XN24 TaxID=2713569 RepID=UPI0013EE2BA3|nr:flagellar filament capping protein FliD [Wenzhouxiangella sp. XN24]NGX16222.1 flagellar filament capping protein FliD [Wenzhouxiangella sp. XN24]